MMRLAKTFGAALALALGATTGAYASPIEAGPLEKGKQKIAPEKGYVYLTAPDRFAGSFIRIADQEDVAAYRKARAKAFAEQVTEYKKDYARWKQRIASLKTGAQPPEEPEKPDEATFAFPSIEQFFASSFGPTFAFAKDPGAFAYFEELKPGTYIWYGPVFYGPKQGYLGQCYCMGSIKFDVAPGVITNLGNSLFAMPRWEEDRGAPTPQIKENSGLNGFVVELPQQSGALKYDLPPILVRYQSVISEFSAVGKINNFYGQMVARIAPIEGVIAYDRDRVRDLRAEAAAAAPSTPAPAT